MYSMTLQRLSQIHTYLDLFTPFPGLHRFRCCIILGYRYTPVKVRRIAYKSVGSDIEYIDKMADVPEIKKVWYWGPIGWV